MIKIEVGVDDSQLQELFSAMEAAEASSLFPNTRKAFGLVSQQIAMMWRSWAMGGSIEGVKNIPRPDPELAQSIRMQKHGPFEYEISTNNPNMGKIENGTPEIDMKDPNGPWLRSKKTRVSHKNGKDYPYLIIPFSWRTGKSNAKNVVPMNIVELLKTRETSVVLASPDPNKLEPNRYGQMIPRNKYQWGGRISDDEASHTIQDENGNMVKSGYDSGMVRMWDSAFSNSVHGKYFTFRVLSVKSKTGWIRKAKDGIKVVERIAEIMQPEVEKAVSEGLRIDLELN